MGLLIIFMINNIIWIAVMVVLIGYFQNKPVIPFKKKKTNIQDLPDVLNRVAGVLPALPEEDDLEEATNENLIDFLTQQRAKNIQNRTADVDERIIE
jgi:hypothetical protein